MDMISTLLGTKNDLTALQECARAVLIFVYGLVLVRVMGRRVFAKWSALDIVLSVVVGSNLSRALTGSAPLWGTLLATAVMSLLHWLLAKVAARSSAASRFLEGSPVVLVDEGSRHPDRLVKHAVSAADLDEAMRQTGLDDLAQARKATLEPSGKITFLKA